MKRTEQLQNIYSNHAEELYRFCKFKTRSSEDAEDLVSEAFIKLFEQDEFDGIQNPRAWLYKVARNMIYDNTKKHTTSNIDDDQIENISSSDLSVEKESVNDATIEYLESQMQNLDDDTADIIIMRVWDDMKFTDIAEAMSMGVDAVRKRFNRGIKQLKNLVSSEEKMLNIKSVSIPFILAGILGISVQPAYAFSAASSASIATAVGSTLGFTFSNMINSNVNAGAATAGTGILATTAAKLIAGSAILVAGAGVGIGAVAIQSNQPEPTPTVQEQDQKDLDEASSSKEIFTYEEYGIRFHLPKQDSYEAIEFNMTDVFDEDNKMFAMTERTFTDYDNKVLQVYYTPERFIGFPCGLGCVGESIVSISYNKNTTVNTRLSEIQTEFDENTIGLPNYGITNQTQVNKFGTSVTKLDIVGVADFFPNKYLFQNGDMVVEIDTFLDTSNQDVVDFFNSIEAIEVSENENPTLSKLCTYSSIGLQFNLPEGWDCGYTDSSDELLWVNIENPWYDIHFSKLGRGPYCGDGPQEPGNTCVTKVFADNGFMSADEYISNGELGEIFGTFLNTPGNTWDGWWISIRETQSQRQNGSSFEVNSEQRDTLKAILNSFQKI
ncbi:sigma-70 family RNA polymerase sigma factor [Candidatus Dojkabacteria bacterium]|uniref:Sigma-70 family RNA polymerase sigma factor n=1 Tax=Candidatus Dojkabacteria bacterium TaxID=2099670 RepID=A0A955RLG3_9BACT|nr:sigma-70 family RNA polymerase sigma factor [Candidatus Dojkabacteria bacterium]